MANRVLRSIASERVVQRLPLPGYVISLGEIELAAGRRAAGLRDLELVRAQERLQKAGGVIADAEIAIFEADHGDPQRAVRIAERAYAAAPSVRSADALGWALTRAGRPGEGLAYAERALRLGSRDPLFLYHAGIAARAAGEANSPETTCRGHWRPIRASRLCTRRGPARRSQGCNERLRPLNRGRNRLDSRVHPYTARARDRPETPGQWW